MKGVTFENTIITRFNRFKELRSGRDMKYICTHPTCDREALYKHDFQNEYHGPSETIWYRGEYCAEHMAEHLEHCVNVIRNPHLIETP
jgi:hypothetical protein